MSADPKVVAALIVTNLRDQDDMDGYVRAIRNADGSADLTDVTIDGHFDLEALAAAIITEVRNAPE